MSNTLALACRLIRCPSVTPDDAGCMDLVASCLETHGYRAETLNFGDTRNLWLRRGEASPLLVFLGHTDVVPAGPEGEWASPPFVPTLRDGFLYGRGAADMKGSIAAMVTALRGFATRYPQHRGSVGLLLTSDEEGAATHGVVKVIETFENRGEKIDWCVVGEPSSFDRLGDVIRIGRRGSLGGSLRILGVQGHVAYPDNADNPIHHFAPALAELAAEVWDTGNEFFTPTSFQVSNLKAGTGADNVIPGRLDALFNFRYSTASTAEDLKDRVHAILERHGLRYELVWRLSGTPFLTTGSTLIEASQAALEAVVGARAKPDTGGGTSDGRFVAPTGAEVVEIGPINASIHKLNEHVKVADIESLAAIYERIMFNLLCASSG